MKELHFDNYDDWFDFMFTAFKAKSKIELRIISYTDYVYIPILNSLDELQGAMIVCDQIAKNYFVLVDGTQVFNDFDL